MTKLQEIFWPWKNILTKLSNEIDRNRIIYELKRVANNDFFMRTPLIVRMVIMLMINKKVDIEKAQNISELYLMLLLKNLKFQEGGDDSFTELEPAEHQDYFKDCLKLCQHQIQNKSNVMVIKGVQKNVKNLGQCFETNALGEKLQIPIEFIKTMGIFEYVKDQGEPQLHGLHLSYIEFGCAASFCRTEVNLENELSLITDTERFFAVVTFLGGLFSNNHGISYLTKYMNLCKNFLSLLDHEDCNNSLQKIFKSIIAFKHQGEQLDNITFVPELDAYDNCVCISIKFLRLLMSVMNCSGGKIENFPIHTVEFPVVQNEKYYEVVLQFKELQKGTEVERWHFVFAQKGMLDWEVARHWLNQKQITTMSAKVKSKTQYFPLNQVPSLPDLESAFELYNYLKDGRELCRMIGMVTEGRVPEGIFYR